MKTEHAYLCPPKLDSKKSGLARAGPTLSGRHRPRRWLRLSPYVKGSEFPCLPYDKPPPYSCRCQTLCHIPYLRAACTAGVNVDASGGKSQASLVATGSFEPLRAAVGPTAAPLEACSAFRWHTRSSGRSHVLSVSHRCLVISDLSRQRS